MNRSILALALFASPATAQTTQIGADPFAGAPDSEAIDSLNLNAAQRALLTPRGIFWAGAGAEFMHLNAPSGWGRFVENGVYENMGLSLGVASFMDLNFYFTGLTSDQRTEVASLRGIVGVGGSIRSVDLNLALSGGKDFEGVSLTSEGQLRWHASSAFAVDTFVGGTVHFDPQAAVNDYVAFSVGGGLTWCPAGFFYSSLKGGVSLGERVWGFANAEGGISIPVDAGLVTVAATLAVGGGSDTTVVAPGVAAGFSTRVF